MNLFKRLFGGGSSKGDPDGIYFYVRSDQTGEVIQVRLHRYNDLSQHEEGSGFYCRKIVVGQRGFDRMEVEFFFDARRNLTGSDIAGGKLVTREVYEQYLAEQQHKSNLIV